MAHFHVKKKNGRPYLYVREIARVNGKPTVVSQIYIGSPDKVATLAKGGLDEDTKLKVEQFGALWLAALLDADIDLAGIIDAVIPRGAKEKGPSVGEYFLYNVLNRMVEPRSKNRLADWYAHTAIQQIRPIDIRQLSSQKYWEKWERVSEKQLDEISRRFFEKIWEKEKPEADCLLFDTTNFYTFMAGRTKSELAATGHNKAGRHHLRQVGLGLLVDRASGLPLYYRVYPGNLHDSRLFEQAMQEMFGIVCGLSRSKERLTVVVDKGMNSEDNFSWIDEHARVHFVTTYSTYFASDLAHTPLERFEPIEIPRNRRLQEQGLDHERLLAYRTSETLWGKERTLVVTHNPTTARKQAYTLESKLESVRQDLLAMRAKVREQAPHWRDADKIRERYLRLCEQLHVASDLYTLEFASDKGRLSMSFRKDPYRVERKQAGFGRNIIVTDNTDWTTPEIVQASLDRWRVEDSFRSGKDHDLVSVQPLRHWTDGKIRCHLFACVVAMTYLKRLELRLRSAGVERSAADVMDDMRRLHSVLCFKDGRSKPRRRLEQPTKTQKEVLNALGYEIDPMGVLHP